MCNALLLKINVFSRNKITFFICCLMKSNVDLKVESQYVHLGC